MDDENASESNNQKIPIKKSKRWFASLRKQKDLQRQESQSLSSSDGDLKKKRNRTLKNEDSVFQRIKFKINKFPLRLNQTNNNVAVPNPIDSNIEKLNNLSCENINKIVSGNEQLVQESDIMISNHTDDDSEKPFTHHYRRHIAEKWIEKNSYGPNLIMYKACTEMINHVWYWGETSREDAQKQLTDKPNGSFLVRDSESYSETDGNRFSLSFRTDNRTYHYRIQYVENCWHFEERQYKSMVDMIEDIMFRSTDENFVCYVKTTHKVLPVFLRYPISRYIKIPTLQDLSKRAINQKFKLKSEDFEMLPIPVKLQQFLTEKNSLIF